MVLPWKVPANPVNEYDIWTRKETRDVLGGVLVTVSTPYDMCVSFMPTERQSTGGDKKKNAHNCTHTHANGEHLNAPKISPDTSIISRVRTYIHLF